MTTSIRRQTPFRLPLRAIADRLLDLQIELLAEAISDEQRSRVQHEIAEALVRTVLEDVLVAAVVDSMEAAVAELPTNGIAPAPAALKRWRRTLLSRFERSLRSRIRHLLPSNGRPAARTHDETASLRDELITALREAKAERVLAGKPSSEKSLVTELAKRTWGPNHEWLSAASIDRILHPRRRKQTC